MSCLAIDVASLTGIAKPMPMLPRLAAATDAPSEAIARVDADELAAGVDQRAAAVAGVDRGGGLDRVGHDRVRRRLGLGVGVGLRAVARRSLSASVVTGRLSALTMPVVTVPARPSGLPTAMTGSPTAILSELPMAIGVRSLGAFFTVMTARSVDGSVPTTSAS